MRVQKKSVMGEIISVFVMILVVSILAGLTFLFVAALKTQSVSVSAYKNVTVTNESVTFDALNTHETLASSTQVNVKCGGLTYVANGTTTGKQVLIGNFTQNSGTGCALYNATAIFGYLGGNQWNASYVQFVSYTYLTTDPNVASAYNAVNGTESAGYTIVGYLPLIFLAIIFGAILTLVLKIILPFINLGQQVGGF
jgi:hypothetical protein